MKFANLTLSLILLTFSGSAFAQSADQQLRFAEHLQKSGDAPFALLEYKRFVFTHPKDTRAPAAQRQIADIYFGYFQDVAAGKSALAAVIKSHPKSAEAKDAQATLNLFAVHRGANENLLLDYLEGRRLARNGDAKGAEARLVNFANRSQDANLAASALLEAGKLRLTALKKPAEAVQLFEQVVRTATDAKLRHEALYRTGEALEKSEGTGPRTLQAYGLVAAEKGAFQQSAKAAVERIRAAQNLPKRQFDAKLAGNYKTIRNDAGNSALIVTIEVAQGISPDALKATMEKALFENLAKRRNNRDGMVVNAYYSYPVTEAGGVNWKVGSQPQFTVKQMKAEDAVKTLIFDLFKKRR